MNHFSMCKIWTGSSIHPNAYICLQVRADIILNCGKTRRTGLNRILSVYDLNRGFCEKEPHEVPCNNVLCIHKDNELSCGRLF